MEDPHYFCRGGSTFFVVKEDLTLDNTNIFLINKTSAWA